MNKRTVLLLALTLGACASRSPNPPPTPEIRQLRFAAVADSLIYVAHSNTQWGVEVWDQGRNQPVYSHRSYVHMVPASNNKILTTSAAMGLLGPDWRYRTTFSVAGAANDTAPRGLIIKASGDPTWSARFFGSDFAVLDAFADSLAQHDRHPAPATPRR